MEGEVWEEKQTMKMSESISFKVKNEGGRGAGLMSEDEGRGL